MVHLLDRPMLCLVYQASYRVLRKLPCNNGDMTLVCPQLGMRSVQMLCTKTIYKRQSLLGNSTVAILRCGVMQTLYGKPIFFAIDIGPSLAVFTSSAEARYFHLAGNVPWRARGDSLPLFVHGWPYQWAHGNWWALASLSFSLFSRDLLIFSPSSQWPSQVMWNTF